MNIAIVSLSRGTIGEDFVAHEVEIGIRRLEEYGLNVKFMPHALKGIAFVEEHPDLRAKDLLDALTDEDVDMILCAVGGEETYRIMPYFFSDERVADVDKNKIFLGFSDSTINHLMLQKLGMKTFYGQAFLPDICEISDEMLPYTKKYFEELVRTGMIAEITPSDVWYTARESFNIEDIGTDMPVHKNEGFELLQGNPKFSGKIIGGCIDTIYDIFDNSRFEDTVRVCEKYGIFPVGEEWRDKILLIESSEEMATPEKYRKMILKLKEAGVFQYANGALVGKPVNEVYAEEYKEILREVIADASFPVVFNVNVGHATPRCIIPLGVDAVVDCDAQKIMLK